MMRCVPGKRGVGKALACGWMRECVQAEGRAGDDVRGLFSDNTYQPMRAYSTTYQGDDGKKPQQGL